MNQYEPWKELGMTELEYFKMRYLEASSEYEAYGKQEYERGIDAAAALFEGERCIDHEKTQCVAGRIWALKDKK